MATTAPIPATMRDNEKRLQRAQSIHDSMPAEVVSRPFGALSFIEMMLYVLESERHWGKP